jgi:hypothetical protein
MKSEVKGTATSKRLGNTGLDIYAEKIKYTFMLREEKRGGGGNDINLGIKFFENVANFKCFGKV